MSLLTIDEFLAASDHPSNIYVDHPGFNDENHLLGIGM
jgi:hypothetical protein